jgi:hypothetical protein
MDDPDYERYVRINLPHARTIVDRIGRSLAALSAAAAEGNGHGATLDAAFARLERALRDYDQDPPFPAAVRAADVVAETARILVEAVLATPVRGERLGQHVRNLFECLGLPEEGALRGAACGEPPDSPLR